MTRACSRVCALLSVLLVTVSASAWAQALPDLSFEDLMKLDAGQVFGASERLQPVVEAPASVSFITAAEIERYGYRTLADILRGVRGLYVTDDRNFSFIGVRGFVKPGDHNSRILLLINGHRVNDAVLAQALIGPEFGLDPAMFERVEIIRGPASSLYGDSAFFAVVNVITKRGASLDGVSVKVEAGTLGTRLIRAAIGRRLANGLEVAVSGTYEDSDGVDRLYFKAFDTPGQNNGVAENLDGQGVRQLYGRLDFRGLTLTTAWGSRHKDVPTASFGAKFNDHFWTEQTDGASVLVDAEYRRSFGATDMTFRGSFDRLTYDATYPFIVGSAGEPLKVAQTGGEGMRWSASTGLTRVLPGRQTLKAGIEVIDNLRQNQVAGYVGLPVLVLDTHVSSMQNAIYLQDEIKLGRWIIVNGGLRYDHYEAFDRVTPRAALIVLPSSSQSVKYLYGAAFRAPTAYELNTVYFGPRVLDLRPESIDTHELVWERYVNNWLRTSVSTYWYKADQLINGVPDSTTPTTISYVNQGEVRAKGLELEAQIRLKGESRARVSYALQKAVDHETNAELSNSPRHVAIAQVSLRGPTRNSFVSFEARYLSSRITLTGQRVSAAGTGNITMIQPLGANWELSGGVQNMFDAQYADPVSSQHRQDSIEQNGRTARIGLRWMFGQKK